MGKYRVLDGKVRWSELEAKGNLYIVRPRELREKKLISLIRNTKGQPVLKLVE